MLLQHRLVQNIVPLHVRLALISDAPINTGDMAAAIRTAGLPWGRILRVAAFVLIRTHSSSRAGQHHIEVSVVCDMNVLDEVVAKL